MTYFYMSLFLIPSLAWADLPPPVGERVYVLGQAEEPVKIERQGAKEKKSMRDPILIKSQIKVIQVPKVKPPPLVAKPALLKFKPRRILGKYTTPRVAFTQKPLGLERADEPQPLRALDEIMKTDQEIEPLEDELF